MNRLDHIVIAAESLQQGVDYIQQTLGVDIPKGGFHRTMGTYNHLMQLGNEAYLEVIAIDPAAAAPPQPRWFALDEAVMRTALASGPRLITWVMNTPDIHQLTANIDFDIGTPTPLSRDSLSWEIALTDDGRLLNGGLLPYCIQWHSQPHPSNGMADLDCTLKELTLHHNRPQWLADRLAALDATHLVKIETLPDDTAPYLTATIQTPSGIITLR